MTSNLEKEFSAIPRSLVLLDREGLLLDARIADDGQWRFPALSDTLPDRYRKALIAFEDRRYPWHPGVDPFSLVSAVATDARHLQAKRGGSTLTMQVVRVASGNPPRTLFQKAREAFLAVAVNFRYSKREVLRMYADHAPFGGNTVGLEAASWRYFGRPPTALSWGEAALLAVLPNQPSLLRPGRGDRGLAQKRNRLLAKLRDDGEIDSLEANLAMQEPLPVAPSSPPRQGFALLQTLHGTHPGTAAFRSTIDGTLQRSVLAELGWSGANLRVQGIHNAAVVVLDNTTGEVRAYGANLPGPDSVVQAAAMDLVRAPRSSGSILKPFLYEGLFESGELFPWTLVPDVPTVYAGFLPENFDRTWSGAAPAADALALSLNAPAAKLLSRMGVDRFQARLVGAGMTTLDKAPAHYGLSLVLGGAETTLWDLVGMYGRLSADAQLPKRRWNEIRVRPEDSGAGHPRVVFAPASAWWTLEILREVHRPQEDKFWESFLNPRPLAWKTGTSHGHRDAWAVGTSPRWTVATWVGNADGTGMPEIVGREAAAPLMFRIVSLLPPDLWFQRPANGWKTVEICPRSGHPAGPQCPVRESRSVPDVPIRLAPCPYHQTVMVDPRGQRVHESCAAGLPMAPRSIFQLTADMDAFWHPAHAGEPAMPMWSPACAISEDDQLVLVYPNSGSRIFLPRDLDGSLNPIVFQAASSGGGPLHWHVDGHYLGATEEIHKIPALLAPGSHTVTVVDRRGRTIRRAFEILPRD